jgi:apoptotic chromatin condensation inducer in the nucleus
MRRKSERTATKKKASPEKKIEKVKRTRTRRRKQSESSENESGDEATSVQEKEIVSDVIEKPLQTAAKEDSPEEAHDQVWQVKAAAGDVGEIQKLKICLTRPPSTPERVDRSPRSKRKHSRATSSSDTPSNEGVEEKKKSKHRSKKSNRESKDDTEKNHDSQDEPDVEAEKSSNEISQSTYSTEDSIPDDTPMSTTNEEVKINESPDKIEISESQEEPQDEVKDIPKSSDADTTVDSPKVETTAVSSETDANENSLNETVEQNQMESCRDSSEDKSEILELHAEDNRCDTSDTEMAKPQTEETGNISANRAEEDVSTIQVSNTEDETENQSTQSSIEKSIKPTDEPDVVVNNEKTNNEARQTSSMDVEPSSKNTEEQNDSTVKHLERSDSTQSATEESSTTPIVISRKRRWGSRPSKITTQKSITISTEVLKDIIPDVKPAEFEEVIEEKKNKREVTEKIEKPILPKIVIDNSENVEQNKKYEVKERESVKPKDSQISSNRKISIVKENDSIIARPPSPPRNKQSCILYITNLVRPFTLPQLKNLLQRTGRIEEEGFWIDRIKSKCFVKYETEE